MIMHVHPLRGAVIDNSAVDSKGNQLPSHARLFTIILPADIPMIYNATLQLSKEDGTFLCHEVAFNIRINLPTIRSTYSYQTEDLIEVEYPLPKIKLTGQYAKTRVHTPSGNVEIYVLGNAISSIFEEGTFS